MGIELDIICAVCGGELSASSVEGENGPALEVEPCQACLQERQDQGYEEGLGVGRRGNED